VQAAHSAVKHHGHWQRIYAQLERRSGGAKAIVAVARRLLVAVWHVLTKACADRFADPLNVARAFFGMAYDIGVRNLPDGLTALGYTRRTSRGAARPSSCHLRSWRIKTSISRPAAPCCLVGVMNKPIV
jgi:hypothetical protein